MKEVSLEIPIVARVEGHGGLYIKIDEEKKEVLEVYFKISEGSRFFEVFTRGRKIEDVPQIASRICGLCGASHAISSALAIENALGIEVPDNIKKLREIVLALNTIESHLIHVLALSLPDYFNLRSFLELPKDFKERTLELLKLRTLIGKFFELMTSDRIHPRNIVPGGFTYLPAIEKLKMYRNSLKKYIYIFGEFLEYFISKIQIPSFERKGHYAALSMKEGYPLHGGLIVINSREKIQPKDFKKYFVEIIVPYATSKKSLLHGKDSYMVGALARINTNFNHLDKEAQKFLKNAGLKGPSLNPYFIPVAQLAEILHFLKYIHTELDNVKLNPIKVSFKTKAGDGVGVVEAPRGLLYHRYGINNEGKVTSADIVTPTAQNFGDIEDSVKTIAPKILEEYDNEITNLKVEFEKIPRCYDPCISCSVHLVLIKKSR